ncbi:MAG: hypothetical protein AB1500_09755 [Bacillota bacterium]
MQFDIDIVQGLVIIHEDLHFESIVDFISYLKNTHGSLEEKFCRYYDDIGLYVVI